MKISLSNEYLREYIDVKSKVARKSDDVKAEIYYLPYAGEFLRPGSDGEAKPIDIWRSSDSFVIDGSETRSRLTFLPSLAVCVGWWPDVKAFSRDLVEYRKIPGAERCAVIGKFLKC